MTEAPVPGRLRWVEHDPTFFSLMLGRVELAQISLMESSKTWAWTLRFTRKGERGVFSAPTEAEARAIAEYHAWKVLTDE